MKAQIKSLFWKLVCTIGGWALLLTLLQGVCNYVFVTRYAVNKDIVQADLFRKQTDRLIAEMKNFPKFDELQLKLLEKSIDKLEREIIKLDSKSDDILKRITIAEKGKIIETIQRDIIKDIIPAIKISQESPYFIDASHIQYNYSLENKGKYSVKIEPTKLYLSTTNMKLDSSDKIANQLLINNDYILTTDLAIGDIAPGEIISHNLCIKLLNPKNIPNRIYYKVVFNAETEPTIIESIKNIKRNEIYYKKYYVYGGEINKPD